jgi:hypothetical protein
VYKPYGLVYSNLMDATATAYLEIIHISRDMTVAQDRMCWLPGQEARAAEVIKVGQLLDRALELYREFPGLPDTAARRTLAHRGQL